MSEACFGHGFRSLIIAEVPSVRCLIKILDELSNRHKAKRI